MGSFDEAKPEEGSGREPKSPGWGSSDDEVASSRGWGPEDAGTSSPSDISGTTSNFSGTAYENEAAGGATFTKENMTEPTSSPGFGGGLTSIPGGKASTGNKPHREKRIKPKLNQLSQKAQEVAGRAQDMAGDLAKQAQEFTDETLDNLRHTVKENPVQSLLIGFGVGCLIGALLPRR